MSIRLYFGLPGAGKTTLLAAHALKYSKRKNFNVYSNVPLNIAKVIPIENEMIGKFNLHDGIILIDEGTLFADSRKFKTFSEDLVKFFCLHRHYRLSIEIFLQNYNRTDLTIRMLADKVYWIRKFGGFTFAVNIPMSVFIPRRDVSDNSGQAGEIENGYYRPPWYSYILCEKIRRKRYYDFFDSFDLGDTQLPELDEARLKHNMETFPYSNSTYDVDEKKLAVLVQRFYCMMNEDFRDQRAVDLGLKPSKSAKRINHGKKLERDSAQATEGEKPTELDREETPET